MSNLIFEKIQQTLAASGLLKIGIAGNFLRIAEAAWPVSLRLLRGGQVVGSASNMLAGDFVRDVDFDGFEVVNGAVGQSVTVQITGGGAGSDRVLGEVSVINGEIQRVKSGIAFIGIAGQAAVAGNYAHTQLWNPAGSGKNLVVSKVSAYSEPQMIVGFADSSAAIASVFGASSSKMLGAAGSVAQLRVGAYAALQGVLKISDFMTPATQSVEFPFSEPLIVPPGRGLLLRAEVISNSLSSTFQWFEEVI